MKKAVKISKSARAILAAARILFWKHGIKRVSVEEVCEAAGVSKMTFYRNFSNKEEVALRVLEEVTSAARKKHERLLQSDEPFSEKIIGMIQLKIEASEGISKELIRDIFKNDWTALKEFIHEQHKISEAMLIKYFKEAQIKGELSKELKIPFILYFLEVIREKMQDERLLAMYNDPVKLIKDIMHFFFYGVAGKNTDK